MEETNRDEHTNDSVNIRRKIERMREKIEEVNTMQTSQMKNDRYTAGSSNITITIKCVCMVDQVAPNWLDFVGVLATNSIFWSTIEGDQNIYQINFLENGVFRAFFSGLMLLSFFQNQN